AVVGEGDRGPVPVGLVGFDSFDNPAHAVVDGRIVFQADDDVTHDRLCHRAGFGVEVLAHGVSPHEYGHVQAEFFVGLPDDRQSIALWHNADVPIVGAEAGQLPSEPDFSRQLQDGVAGGLAVD